MNELKKRIIELKKNILYAKMIEEKIVEFELNTPRTFRTNDGMSTFRSLNLDEINNFYGLQQSNSYLFDTKRDGQLLLTNRSNKSVRFDNEYDEHNDEKYEDIEKNKIDSLTEEETSGKYKQLQSLVDKIDKKETSSLSLSLPTTPRSVNLSDSSNPNDAVYVDKKTSRSMEELNDKINKNYIKE